MNPEVSILTAVLTIAQHVTNTELWGATLVVFVLPWLSCLYIAMRLTHSTDALKEQLTANREADHERFKAVSQFYADNVQLVERGHEREQRGAVREEKLFDLIEHNTRAVTKLSERLAAVNFLSLDRRDVRETKNEY